MRSKPARRRSIGLAILVFALGLLAAGCGTGDTIDQGTKFDSASKDALVVMGVKSTQTDWLDYEITWWPIDPRTKQFLGSDDDSITVGRAASESYSNLGLTDMRYLIFQAPPGEYALYSTRIKGRDIYTTHYRPVTPSFAATGGEIIYIGDFIFEVPEIGLFNRGREVADAKFRPSGRDDRAAQAAIYDYPHVNGTATYRPLTVVRVN